MIPTDNQIEAKAYEFYCEFIRDASDADYRWANRVSQKVKDEFRAEARIALLGAA